LRRRVYTVHISIVMR